MDRVLLGLDTAVLAVILNLDRCAKEAVQSRSENTGEDADK
jgi:hypothetical protein